MDWSISLWSHRDGRHIASFEDSDDYISDVAWLLFCFLFCVFCLLGLLFFFYESFIFIIFFFFFFFFRSPVHPGVFASVDGSGFLSMWNLNANTEVCFFFFFFFFFFP